MRSTIQATDSTCTGWTAKSAPASQAPASPMLGLVEPAALESLCTGSASLRASRKTSTEFSACSSTFVTWWTRASSPNSWCSIQNVV